MMATYRAQVKRAFEGWHWRIVTDAGEEIVTGVVWWPQDLRPPTDAQAAEAREAAVTAASGMLSTLGSNKPVMDRVWTTVETVSAR